jgi:hypothetical protein
LLTEPSLFSAFTMRLLPSFARARPKSLRNTKPELALMANTGWRPMTRSGEPAARSIRAVPLIRNDLLRKPVTIHTREVDDQVGGDVGQRDAEVRCVVGHGFHGFTGCARWTAMMGPLVGHHVPEDVEGVHRQHPHGSDGEPHPTPLHVARDQEKERKEEVDDGHRQRDFVPAALHANDEELGLFGHVGVPAQNKLAKRDLRQKQCVIKEEFTDVVIVLGRDGACEHEDLLNRHHRQRR